MHTVELLEDALAVAEQLGYKLRQDWFGGDGGGGCEIKGQKWIFLDLAQSPADQLDQVIQALGNDPGLPQVEIPSALRTLLDVRKSA